MHQDWRKLECFKLSGEGQVTVLRMIHALPVCPISYHNNSSWKLQYVLFQTRTKKWENQPINISESKPRCFPLNNESGTLVPPQERNLLLKNCSLVESSFSFLIPNPFKLARWESNPWTNSHHTYLSCLTEHSQLLSQVLKESIYTLTGAPTQVQTWVSSLIGSGFFHWDWRESCTTLADIV